jgi:hypothetical protein
MAALNLAKVVVLDDELKKLHCFVDKSAEADLFFNITMLTNNQRLGLGLG